MTSTRPPLQWATFIAVVLHAVGAIGILSGFGHVLLPLSGVNLWVACAMLLWVARAELSWWWLAAPLGGLAAEVVGVQTGWLFGDYAYGLGLGGQTLGVPLLLGPLWLMMLWGAWSVTAWLGLRSRPLRVGLAAGLMTSLDGLIEPVAIHAGWWAWATPDGGVPWTNYASWFGVAVALLAFAPATEAPNPATRPGTSFGARLFLIFGVFFTLLNLFAWNP